MYLLYRSRHVVSWLPALVVAGCLLFVSQQAVLQVKPHYDDTVMELSLAEPEPPQPAKTKNLSQKTMSSREASTRLSDEIGVKPYTRDEGTVGDS